MMLILCIALLISYLLLTVVVYNQTFQNLQAEVEQEARYIKEAIDISGTEYLQRTFDLLCDNAGGWERAAGIQDCR